MHDISDDTLNMISRVYDAAISPAKWPDIIDDVTDHFNAVGSTLFYSDSHNPDINPIATCWSEFWRSGNKLQYLSDVATDEPSALLLHKRKPREIMTSENINDEERKRVSNFFNKVKSMFGIEALVASRLTQTGAWFDYITLQYDTNHGPIRKNEIYQLEILLPHLSKSLEISRPMILLEQRFNRVLEALNHFHIGVVILSVNKELVVSNNTADKIIGLSDGLLLDKKRRILALDNNDNAKLQQSIINATNTRYLKGNFSGALLRINRRSGKEAFLVEVAPLSDIDSQSDSNVSGSILFLLDPDDPGIVSTRGLKTLYNLTSIESEVCRLIAEGHSNREIAEIRNVSPETIKTQVHSLLRKTQVFNRAELIRRALTINLPIDNKTT